jgi:hypothetical protein
MASGFVFLRFFFVSLPEILDLEAAGVLVVGVGAFAEASSPLSEP